MWSNHMATAEAESEPEHWCSCGESFGNAGELGSHISEKGDGHEPSEEPPEGDSGTDDSETMTDESTNGSAVGWIGGLDFVVSTDDGLFKVNAAGGNPEVEELDVDDASAAVLRELAVSQPAQPQMDAISARTVMDMHRDVHNLVQTTQQMVASGGGGGGGASGGSSGGGDGGSSDADPVSENVTLEHDYDLDALADDLNEWIENYANVKTKLDPNCVEIEPAQTNQGHADVSSEAVGFTLNHGGPWKWTGGGYDSSDNEWTDDDQKEAFGESRSTFGEIMKDADEVQYFGEPHWVNFVPASKVGELVG